jgi:hypothetical protein
MLAYEPVSDVFDVSDCEDWWMVQVAGFARPGYWESANASELVLSVRLEVFLRA